MSALPPTPISAGTIPRVESSESHTIPFTRESVATYSLSSPDSESEPELDCNSFFTGPSFTLSRTYSHPEASCFPRTYYHSRSTSATSSSRPPTPPSFADNRPQTPPSPHDATSFLATPSPLCLGPSQCHIALDNVLEGGTVYVDKTCDVTEDDELPELITPVSFPIDDSTYTSTQERLLSHPVLLPSSPPYSTPRLFDTIGNTRPRAMTLPTDSVISQPDSPNDYSALLSGVVPSLTDSVHHTLHRKKSMLNLRDEFRKRSSTC